MFFTNLTLAKKIFARGGVPRNHPQASTFPRERRRLVFRQAALLLTALPLK
jgi:hypothetical protein